MRNTIQYQFALHKKRVDVGYGITYIIKWFLGYFAASSQNVQMTFTLSIIWIISCYFLGWFWIDSRMMEAEQEVNNQNDTFVKEMRELSGAVLHP